MEEKGIKFEAAPRKNMNRLMSLFECYHIKLRSIIESDWGTLKNNCQLEYHKARSIVVMCSGRTLFSRSFQIPSQPFTLIYQSELYSCQRRKTAIAPGPDFLCLFPPFKIVFKKDIHLRVAASCVVKKQCNFFYVFAVNKEFADF